MHQLLTELVSAWRAVRARALSTVGIAAVMTVGIGLSTAMFAITDPFLWRPLPYGSASRLVLLRLRVAPASLMRRPVDVLPTLSDWQARTDLFEDVAAFGSQRELRVKAGGVGGLLTLRTVSPNFLSVLGLEAIATPQWHPPAGGGPTPLVLLPSFERRGFGIAEALVGATLTDTEGRLFNVVASTPESFLFPQAEVGFRPDALSPTDFGNIANTGPAGILEPQFSAVARLKSSVTAEQAQRALMPRVAQSGLFLEVLPLASYMTSTVRPLALGALAASLLIAIACAANVVNLTVTRQVHRRREFATRQALGGSRRHLAHLVVLDLMILTAGAVVASLGMAGLTLIIAARIIPEQYSSVGQPALSWRAAGFAFLVGLGILMSCLIPCMQAAGRRTGRFDAPEAKTLRFMRFVMTGSQGTVAMILAVGATLVIRSYANLWAEETGYSKEARVAAVSYPPFEQGRRLVDEVSNTLAALRLVRGINEVGAAVAVGPLLDNYSTFGGERITTGATTLVTTTSRVTATYFDAAGTKFLAGRSLQAGDDGWRGVVVNEAFARLAWPDHPLSEIVTQTVTFIDRHRIAQVVGVVQNARDRALDQPVMPKTFRLLEATDPLPRRVNYVIRTAGGDFNDASLRRQIASVNPDAAVEVIDSLDGRLAQSVRDKSFGTLVLVLFGAAGLAVTATGVIAMIAFVTARRTPEIAIRLAIGATARDVCILVARDVAFAIITGATLGLIAARAVAIVIQSQLYHVQSGDLWTPVIAALALLSTSVLAALLPAIRAIRLNPVRALRLN